MEKAEEIKDNSGYTAGSREYFRHINENSAIGRLALNKESEDYFEILNYRGSIVGRYVQEISDSLKNAAAYLFLIDSSKRDKLADFIKGLYIFSGWTGYAATECNKCIDLLKLSQSGAKKMSNASESDIDNAVNVMYNEGKSNIYSPYSVITVNRRV